MTLLPQTKLPADRIKALPVNIALVVLSEACSVIVEDLGEIPLVSVDFFTRNVLPPIHDDVLGKVKASLIAKKHIKGNRWTAFPKSPKTTGAQETRAFSAFPTMVGHIMEATSPLIESDPALEFVYKPNEAPASEHNNASRPDGQLELKVKKSLGALTLKVRLWSQIPQF